MWLLGASDTADAFPATRTLTGGLSGSDAAADRPHRPIPRRGEVGAHRVTIGGSSSEPGGQGRATAAGVIAAWRGLNAWEARYHQMLDDVDRELQHAYRWSLPAAVAGALAVGVATFALAATLAGATSHWPVVRDLFADDVVTRFVLLVGVLGAMATFEATFVVFRSVAIVSLAPRDARTKLGALTSVHAVPSDPALKPAWAAFGAGQAQIAAEIADGCRGSPRLEFEAAILVWLARFAEGECEPVDELHARASEVLGAGGEDPLVDLLFHCCALRLASQGLAWIDAYPSLARAKAARFTRLVAANHRRWGRVYLVGGLAIESVLAANALAFGALVFVVVR